MKIHVERLGAPPVEVFGAGQLLTILAGDIVGPVVAYQCYPLRHDYPNLSFHAGQNGAAVYFFDEPDSAGQVALAPDPSSWPGSGLEQPELPLTRAGTIHAPAQFGLSREFAVMALLEFCFTERRPTICEWFQL